MAEYAHQYGQIFLGSRGGVTQGQLKLHNNGFTWRKSTGGKIEEVKKADIVGLIWTRIPARGFMLGVRRKDDTTVNFMGFREKDLDPMKNFAKATFGLDLQVLDFSTSGRNWGSVAINGSSLMFMVGNKVGFEVPLLDVSQAQQAKDEIVMEFHTDDTAGDDQEDMLVEMAFHIPPTNQDYPGEGEENSAKALFDQVTKKTDIGVANKDDAMCIFDGVMLIAPRGRFEVEMHQHFLKLVGQTQDFKIRYTSITHLFVLPKHTVQTLVVISLEPPLRKGQTFYQHLLCQFPSDEESNIELDITDEQLESIITRTVRKDGFKLEKEINGSAAEAFAKLLRGLTTATMVNAIDQKEGFRNTENGYAVRCSYKTDDGLLFPLRKYFFYVHKPPFFVSNDEIEAVEFQRQGGGVLQSSIRTFDLVLRTKNSQEFQFRNIQRSEWTLLFNFIKSRNLRIENLDAAQQGPGAAKGLDFDVDIDPGKAHAAIADSDDEDEDFAGDDESSGSGSDSGSDGEGSSGAEMVDEEDIEKEEVSVKKKKKAASEPPAKKPKSDAAPKPKPVKAPKAPKEPAGPSGAKEKKPRKKKDPNAPKKAMTAFLLFSTQNRARIVSENPGISFGDVQKKASEEWKAMGPEQKEKYESQSARDKERYAKEMSTYNAAASGAADE